MDRANSNSSIVCYYVGTDAWGPVRWHRYFAVDRCIVRAYPDEAEANNVTSNLELLNATRKALFGEAASRMGLEASLCAIDLRHQDLDAEVLARLSELIVDFKSAIALSAEQSEGTTRCPIVLLLPQALMESRNWVASVGADLVVERSRDLREIVQSAAGSMPCFAKSVHPWLAGLAIDARQ